MTSPNGGPEQGRGTPKTILVATDFSRAADNALERACEFARSSGARLILSHSVTLHVPPAGGPRLMNLPLDFESRVRDASLEALEERAESVRAKSLDAVSELTTGPPVPSLLRLAKEEAADLIVVGTRGMTGFAHLLLGSTAEQLIAQAHCPVISVHPHDHQSLDRVRRVLIPTDYSDDAELVASTLAELLGHRSGSVEIVLLHAYHLPAGISQLLGYYPLEDSAAAGANTEARRSLDPMADRLRERGFEVEVLVKNGYPAEVIASLSESMEIDLIAMGTRGLSGLKGVLRGSTARRVVQYARCPVLTVALSED